MAPNSAVGTGTNTGVKANGDMTKSNLTRYGSLMNPDVARVIRESQIMTEGLENPYPVRKERKPVNEARAFRMVYRDGDKLIAENVTAPVAQVCRVPFTSVTRRDG